MPGPLATICLSSMIAWSYWPWLIRLCACNCICAGLLGTAGTGVVADVVGAVCVGVVGVVAVCCCCCVGVGFFFAFGFRWVLVCFVCTMAAVPLSDPPFDSATIAPAITSTTATSAATGIQRGRSVLVRVRVGRGGTGRRAAGRG